MIPSPSALSDSSPLRKGIDTTNNGLITISLAGCPAPFVVSPMINALLFFLKKFTNPSAAEAVRLLVNIITGN